MKAKLTAVISVTVLFMSCGFLSAQQQSTPYDNFPGIYKSYKPVYDDQFPAWAKMLYSFPVNFNNINAEYAAYTNQHPDRENAINRYFKIWSRIIEPYALPDGTIQLPNLDQYYKNLRHSQLASVNKNNSKNTDSDWSFLGPKETFWLNESGSADAPASCPWQANVYSFDVANSDHNILYCGTETGFVNKTTDKGLSWQFISRDYPFGGGVTAIAIDPENSDIVYAAAGNEVHKTTDGGLTWVPLPSGSVLFNADRLRIDPSNPGKLIAASSDGVFISNNAGISWLQESTQASYDIVFRPNDSTTIYALTQTGGNFSMILSIDGGLTFQPMAGFPNNIVASDGGLLAATPANPNILIAILLSANNTPYLLKGTVNNGNWTWITLATGQTGSFAMDNGQGYFDLVLDVSPIDENVILVGTCTLYKSTDGGLNFSAVGGYDGNFNIHPDIQDIKMMPDGDTWVATDGGMNLTTDNFDSISNYFIRVNGIVGSDMWGFDQGWNEDIVVGGRYHNGNTAMASFYQPKALRMGGAESPTGWVLQGKSHYAAFNDLGDGWILPKTAGGEPEGRFIFSKYPNMDEYGGRRGNLVFHPNYYGTIYLGEGSGFWRSPDMGTTFDLLYTFPDRVMYFQISYSNPDVFYADIQNYGLYKSNDGGNTWISKPSLTSFPNGSGYWDGKLFIAISPYDENRIYACLQNGAWSADIGKIFRSDDGGDTWEDWTGSISEYLKCIVVQPTSSGHDLVYLFTNASDGHTAKVYYRKEGMPDWTEFENSYPAGMNVNLALPFFRDGKLRVAGTCGVWESTMAEPDYLPIVNPWIEKAHYNCMLDTLYFDDHSILNHAGASWHWEITPAPAYFENPDIRNPRVVLGTPGTYDVSLTVTQNGQNYTKQIPGMVTATTCPSINDCNNPAGLDKSLWSLVYADSQEQNYPGLATMSFDDDPGTIWHTRWSTGDDPYPHEIRIDLGDTFRLYRFTYLTRQDGENGRIKDYKLYISSDTTNWGTPVNTGQFVNTSAPQTIELNPSVVGKYFRLVALSEVNGNPWASAAEFYLVGCTNLNNVEELNKPGEIIKAFPVPGSGIFNVSLPALPEFTYILLSSGGQLINKGQIKNSTGYYSFNLCNESSGVYFIYLTDQKGIIYKIKVIKE
ncbi:MAG: discoidin domain-containing protein [Bacteroidia bacterium]|nr:discoidin domain-containing protein [Bacteroidia bacterium]